MVSGSAEFKNPEEAKASPLAQALFGIEGVQGIFLGSDFISVTRTEQLDWDALKPLILGAIMDHFTTGAPVMLDENDTAPQEKHKEYDGEEAEIVAQIIELLDTRVRPAVAQDGGDIVFHGFENGIVYLHMQGACSGCPSASMTLKAGVENLLRHYVPEVTEVRPV